MRRLLLALGGLLSALVLIAVTALPANAARQNVINGDCAHRGRVVTVRDGSGHQWRLKPNQGVNMRWPKRQVWIPARTVVFKSTRKNRSCPDRPFRTNYGSGYWTDFGWRGANIVFSYCPVYAKPACQNVYG